MTAGVPSERGSDADLTAIYLFSTPILRVVYIRREIGEGFIIDYDKGITLFEGMSIEDWVIDFK